MSVLLCGWGPLIATLPRWDLPRSNGPLTGQMNATTATGRYQPPPHSLGGGVWPAGDASFRDHATRNWGPFWDQYSNPQRLRPLRWTSQRVNATEATTAMMSRMSVLTAVIYLSGSHANCANSMLI